MTYKMEVPAMTAVIYARYSSDNQREESIEGQIRECTAYAEKNGITIVKHYIDRAISAKTDNRPEFQQMIKDSDKKLFDKAEDDYLLTTKLFCGCCGALMFGESGTSRTGEVHRYYKCATAKKKKGCKKKTVRKQWLEDLVVNQTMQLVRDDAAMESIIAKVMELQDRENTNLPLYEKQLRDAESGIQNMLNAIQAGILTSSTKERLEQLEETKRELEARIAEEKLAKPKIKEEFIRFWLLRFRKLDMSLKDQRQALVDTFINSIYLYDDKVLITFNYKEGTQTITFEEAAQAASKGNGSDLDCIPAPRKTRTHCVLVFLFVSTMEGARTGRRRAAPQAISPVGCCLARGFQRVGMSTVEAVNRKISWLFCFVSHGCAVAERVRLIPRRFKTEKMKFYIDKTSRQVYNRTWKQQGITAKSARMPLWIETG